MLDGAKNLRHAPRTMPAGWMSTTRCRGLFQVSRGAPGGPGGDGSGGGDRGSSGGRGKNSTAIVNEDEPPMNTNRHQDLMGPLPRPGYSSTRRSQRTARKCFCYCCSELRAHKEPVIVERFSRHFEQGLSRLSEGLSRPRPNPRIDKASGEDRAAPPEIRAGSGALPLLRHGHHRGPHRRAAARSRLQHRPGKLQPGNRFEGHSCGRSTACAATSDSRDEESLWRPVVRWVVKSELGLRPIYHLTSRPVPFGKAHRVA